MAKVVSIWEDQSTGSFKFRARSLVHAMDLPSSTLSQLHATRRAFGNEVLPKPGVRECERTDGSHDDGAEGIEEGESEVFLTERMEDVEMQWIVKPVILSVATNAIMDTPSERRDSRGFRSSHAFDEWSGHFAPIEGADPILKRARIRQSYALARASSAGGAHETKSGMSVARSEGWLLPKRGAIDWREGTHAATSDRSTRSATLEVLEQASCDLQREGSSTSKHKGFEQDTQSLKGIGHTIGEERRRSPPLFACEQAESTRRLSGHKLNIDTKTDFCGTGIDANAVSGVTAAARPSQRYLCLSPPKCREPQFPRPRRLTLPPRAGEHAVVQRSKAVVPLAAETAPVVGGGLERTSVARQTTWQPSTRPSLRAGVANPSRRSMNSRKRKRRCATKLAAEVNEPECHRTRSRVGKDYQVTVPSLLSPEDKTKQLAQNSDACLVWRSTRDWDMTSRELLATYLQAADVVAREKQARPDTAVHVRLGGENACNNGNRDKPDNNTTHDSHAVWAVTATGAVGTRVNVACSRRAQTQVPLSAIQRVQYKEEALAALVNAKCSLNDYYSALEAFRQDPTSPESLQPWTLTQVRMLEGALQKEYNPSRRLYDLARPGTELDREDYIDFVAVCAQVPGKTPAQVLAFYYKYLAFAKPLTDVVYGPKAAQARAEETVASSEAGETSTLSQLRVGDGDNIFIDKGTPLTAVSTPNSASHGAPSVSCQAAIETVVAPVPVRPNAQTSAPELVVTAKGEDATDGCRHGVEGPQLLRQDRSKASSSTAAQGWPTSAMSGSNPVADRRSPGGHHDKTSKRDGERDGTGQKKRARDRDHSVTNAKLSRTICSKVEIIEVQDDSDEEGRAHLDDAVRVPLSVKGATQLDPRVASSSVHFGVDTLGGDYAAGHVQVAPCHERVLAPRTRTRGRGDSREQAAELWPASSGTQSHTATTRRCQTRGQPPFDDGSERTKDIIKCSGAAHTSSQAHDDFGCMAPCWRLLLQAKPFVDEERLLYLRGLLLAHAESPMSRDQVLERAQCCLAGHQHVLVAFTKMFDFADQSSLSAPRCSVPSAQCDPALLAKSRSGCHTPPGVGPNESQLYQRQELSPGACNCALRSSSRESPGQDRNTRAVLGANASRSHGRALAPKSDDSPGFTHGTTRPPSHTNKIGECRYDLYGKTDVMRFGVSDERNGIFSTECNPDAAPSFGDALERLPYPIPPHQGWFGGGPVNDTWLHQARTKPRRIPNVSAAHQLGSAGRISEWTSDASGSVAPLSDPAVMTSWR